MLDLCKTRQRGALETPPYGIATQHTAAGAAGSNIMSGDDSSDTYSDFPGPAYAIPCACVAGETDDDEDYLGAGDRVKRALAEERMNRFVALPECACLRQPRVVSYADVGDPEGCLVFMMLGVDSHRYMALLLDVAAKARGVRLLCLDRPGRGRSSDYEDERANRVLEFPNILKAFCRSKGIESFSLMGQSLGACYALRCAQEMPDMVATTVYLVSPWVPLSVPGSNRVLSAAERLPGWLLKGALALGSAMPRMLYAVGGLSLMVKGCSEEESLMFGSDTTAEVLKAVSDAHEPSQGVYLDALAALEKIQPLGFDYRDVSMPVHVFHGRADRMVPFEAAKWMSEEMPACTLSVKVGGTHALLMDAGVLHSVLEFIREDFKHFERQAAGRSLGSAGVKQPFSFPVHTQHFQAEGHLLCREGRLIKGWEERYFLLDGYRLYDLDGPERTTARRVVDLRGAVVRFSKDSDQERSKDSRPRIFHFKLVDAKHRVLYDLGTSTAEERVLWTETITKASRFSLGEGHEERLGTLSRRLLVTTRPGSRRMIGADAARGRDRDPRRPPVPSETTGRPDGRSRSWTGPALSTHGDVLSLRRMSREFLHGIPMRRADRERRGSEGHAACT